MTMKLDVITCTRDNYPNGTGSNCLLLIDLFLGYKLLLKMSESMYN